MYWQTKDVCDGGQCRPSSGAWREQRHLYRLIVGGTCVNHLGEPLGAGAEGGNGGLGWGRRLKGGGVVQGSHCHCFAGLGVIKSKVERLQQAGSAHPPPLPLCCCNITLGDFAPPTPRRWAGRHGQGHPWTSTAKLPALLLTEREHRRTHTAQSSRGDTQMAVFRNSVFDRHSPAV